jgi:uncharacterized repeat protein (TIGR01451 family)
MIQFILVLAIAAPLPAANSRADNSEPPAGREAETANEGAIQVASAAADGIFVIDHRAFGGPGGIIRIDPLTRVQTEVSSQGNFTEPFRGAIEATGTMVVVDLDGRIVRVNLATGAQSVVSSGGNLAHPVAITVAPNGDLLVVDWNGPGVLRVNPLTGAQTVVYPVPLLGATGIAVAPNDDIFVSDQGSRAIYKVNPATGSLSTVTSGGNLVGPNDIAFGPNGEFYVLDGANGGSVFRLDSVTGSQTLVASSGDLRGPPGMAVAPNGDIFVTVQSGPNASMGVVRIDPATGAQAPVSSGGLFRFPSGVVVVGAVPPMPKDLFALAGSASPWSTTSGGTVEFSYTLTNKAPRPAETARIEIVVPPSLTFVSATSSQGTCTPAAPPLPADRKVTCVLGTVPAFSPNNQATATLRVTTSATGPLSMSASGATAQPDTLTANNSATVSVNNWTSAPHLRTTPCCSLSAVTGRDGSIYALGQIFGSGSAGERFNPTTQQWTRLPALPTDRIDMAAAAGADGRIYTFGGYIHAATTDLPTVEAYNPTTGAWESRAPMRTARFLGAAVAANDGRIYVMGGAQFSSGLIDVVEAYDPVTDSWSTRAPMPTPRRAFAAALGPDGRIYAIGGGASGSYVNTVEIYDSATNSWSVGTPMPRARAALAAATGPDGRIYVLGGQFSNGVVVDVVEAYDPRTDTWTTVAPMPSARLTLGATTSLDGRIFAIGGGTSQAVEIYSTASGGPGLNLTVAAPDRLNVVGGQYTPNPFDVMATVRNDGAEAATNVVANLSLPPGLSFATDTSPQRNISSLAPGEQRSVSWSVRGAGQTQDSVLNYFVSVSAANATGQNVPRHIYLPAGALTADGFAPLIGGNAGDVTIDIRGGGFIGGAAVHLGPIVAQDTTVVSAEHIRARFDLRGVPAGGLQLRVANPNGLSATAPGLFTVSEGGKGDLVVNLVGPSAVRGGREPVLYLLLTNQGLVDANDITVDVSRLVRSSGSGRSTQAPTAFAEPGEPTFQVSSVKPGGTVSVPIRLAPVQPGSCADTEVTTRRVRCDELPREADKKDELLFLAEAALGGVKAIIEQTCPGTDNSASLRCQSLMDVRTFSEIGIFGMYDSLVSLLGVWEEKCRKDNKDDRCRRVAALAATLANKKSVLRAERAKAESDMAVYCNAPGTFSQRYCVKLETLKAALEDLDTKYTQLQVKLNTMHINCGQASLPPAGIGPFSSLTVQSSRGSMPLLASDDETLRSLLAPVEETLSASMMTCRLDSIDPNEKFGSSGVGSPRYVQGAILPYEVAFENKAVATAPAQEVVITDQLDTARFDLLTFEVGPITFGETVVIPPPGRRHFSSDVDLRPAKDLILRVSAGIELDTGTATWRFTSLDPGTMLPTQDPFAGFLPPNLVPPQGEGSVLFTVRPKPGLTTGTQIKNEARIVFDENAPIDTPEWLNTIDISKPVSQVLALSPVQAAPTFPVNWSGADLGAGVQDYSIFVSENSGPFATWQANTTATSAIFTGQAGKTYAFYSVARDQAGNQEDVTAVPDATTRVMGDTVAPTTMASVVPPPNGASWNMADVTVTLSASDNAGGLGVAETYYAIDNPSCNPNALATCSTYASPFVISGEGAHTVTFFSKDNEGNFEAMKSQTVRIDRTPPATHAVPSVAPLSNGWYRLGTTIALTAGDNLSGVARTEYNLDNAGWLPYPGPIAVSAGAHTLRYRSVDVAGNQEPEKTLVPPDLTVTTAIEESGPYAAGQTVHIINTVRNLGGSMAASERVFLMDRLPAGAVYRGAAGPGVTCTHTSPDVACERTGLAGGASFSVRIEVQLPPRTPGGGTHLNQVEVDPRNDVGESNELNNRGQVSIPVQ